MVSPRGSQTIFVHVFPSKIRVHHGYLDDLDDAWCDTVVNMSSL